MSEIMFRREQQQEIRRLRDELKKYQWISVKDELPKIDNVSHTSDTVIVYDKSSTTMSFARCVENFFGHCGFDIENIMEFDFVVTHWMPLPELPKENEDATNT